jgi:hypothetical protein
MFKLIKADKDMSPTEIIDYLRENDVKTFIAANGNEYKKFMDREK